MHKHLKVFCMAGAMLIFLISGIHAQCPTVSRPVSSIVVKDRSQLPHDGWAIWNAGGVVKMSRLKNYSPVDIPDARNSKVGLNRFNFSPDGKWVCCAFPNSNGKHELSLLRISDKSVFRLGVTVLSYCTAWYYNSPLERAWDNIYELAYVSDTALGTVVAAMIDLTDPNAPVVTNKRDVVTGVAWNSEFSIAGDLVLRDGPDLSYLFTIPNGGRGTAQNIGPNVFDYYNVKIGANNCASQISPSAKYWSSNQNDRSNPTCVPGNHDGFFVVKTKHATDPVVTGMQWQTDVDKGAVSVCFVPGTIMGMSQQIGSDNKWFGWHFLNDEDYVAGGHISQTNQTNRGGYIVNHRLGIFYEVVPPEDDGGAGQFIAWFDSLPCPVWDLRPKVRVEFLTPSADTIYHVGSSAQVSVSAFSDSGAITSVEFYDNNVLVATDALSPFSCTVANLTDGDHAILAKATDAKGNSGSNTLNIRGESDPVFTYDSIVPARSYVAPGDTASFKVIGLDQYRRVLATQPSNLTATWTIDAAGGTINSSGLLTAKSPGDDTWHTVTADCGGKIATAQVMLPILTPIDGFVNSCLILKGAADTNSFPSKSRTITVDSSLIEQGQIATLVGTDYKWRMFTTTTGRYTWPKRDALVAVAFTVASPMQQTVAMKLKISGVLKTLVVNGQAITGCNADTVGGCLANMTLLQGLNSIVIASACSNPGPVGYLSVEFLDGSGNPVSGLSTAVLGTSQKIAAGFKVLTPSANARYKTGDTCLISWLAGDEQMEADIELSVDNGLTWTTILPQTIAKGTPLWEAYKWVVPETFDIGSSALSLAGKSAIIKVKQYQGGDAEGRSGIFTITSSTSVRARGRLAGNRYWTTKGRTIVADGSLVKSVKVLDTRGRLASSMSVAAVSSTRMSVRVGVAGMYVVRIALHSGKAIEQKLVLP